MNNIFSTYKIIYNQIIDSLSNNTRASISIISGFLLILIIRSLLAIMDTIFIQEEFPIQRIIFILSTGLLIIGMEIGYTKFVFELIDKKERKLNYIFNHFHILGKYLSGLLIFYLIIILFSLPILIYTYFKYGLEIFNIFSSSLLDPYFQELATSYFNFQELAYIVILFSIPTIYVMIRVFFWSYLIIDKEYSGLLAIKTSWILTKNRNLEILTFGIALLFINLLGALTIIGICITLPLSYLFVCLYFRYLLSNK